MFNKKTKLKLTDFECNLLINGMNEFRNTGELFHVCFSRFVYFLVGRLFVLTLFT